MDRREHLARRYRHHGGPAELTRAIRYPPPRRPQQLSQTVLCHNDFIDENLLVAAAGDPVVTGVIDFEPASFDDPWLTSPKRFSTPHSISHSPAPSRPPRDHPPTTDRS